MNNNNNNNSSRQGISINYLYYLYTTVVPRSTFLEFKATKLALSTIYLALTLGAKYMPTILLSTTMSSYYYYYYLLFDSFSEKIVQLATN